MTMSPLNADAFVTDVIRTRAVWGIRDAEGFPTSTDSPGETAMPFWSSEKRARRVAENVAA